MMNARLLFILLALALVLAATQRFRKAGLIATAALIMLLIWFSVQVENAVTSPSASSSASSSSATLTTKPAAQLSAAILDGNGAPWHLTGSLQNISTTMIHAATISIERFDCPTTETLISDCVSIWRGTHMVRVDIPTTAKAVLDERFYSHDELPRLRGLSRDAITLVTVD